MSKTFNKDHSLVSDQVKSDTMNKLSTSCGTDMFPGLFAMKTKLQQDIREYEPRGYQASDEEDKLDDDSNNYKNEGKVPDPIFRSQHSDKENIEKSEREPERYKSDKYSEKHKQKSTEEQSFKGTSSAEPEEKPNYKEKSKEKEFDDDDESTWTKDELMLRKLEMFRKLGELTQCGVKLSQNYTLDSDYKAMKFEHDLHVGIRAKKNSITWMSKMMIGIVQGVEMMNDNMNPFDMKFDKQWSNNVKHDIKDYYDVLGDIYEKYSTPGKKMSPELKLFLMLSGSAVSIQLFKGADSASKQLNKDENLIKSLRKQAQNGDYDNESNVSDEQSGNNSRSSEKSSGYKNRQILQEKMDKEHADALKKAADLRHINESKKEMEKYQQMMNTNSMAKLQQDMMLSDTVASVRSTKSKQSNGSTNKSKNSTNGENIMDNEEYNKQLKLNEQLMKAQLLMKSLQEEEKINKQLEQKTVVSNTNNTFNQALPKHRVLKSTEEDKFQKQQKALFSSSDNESKQSTNSESSNISVNSSDSTASTVSVRSDRSLKKIFGQVTNVTQQSTQQSTQQPNQQLKTNNNLQKSSSSSDSSSSSSSDLSSSSSSKSKSSKSTKSSINIDSDDIRESDKTTKAKAGNQTKKLSDKEITFEAISIGRTSNGSGTTSKRGRPKKNQAPLIQVGK